jgi:hypothetical protein
MSFDRARFIEALAEFDAELHRIRAAETHDLGDLVDVISEVVDPEDTDLIRDRLDDRLRAIRADCAWDLRCALRRFRERFLPSA